ncbi:hypothetical protein H6G89_14635 [Oscillatoria sp. FACHB-1407]|uniref:hypothetical protein n=1 Tax=Oscillatoria sp. FACHB-1407 TaxID=2692847 RepID=UPI0016838532|nr:hypothetical protein [Oscillatoria sp. FACHB-1407]MBD2462282.1 hypothetical protein [Oscillatoria sp. FACHB-1407]
MKDYFRQQVTSEIALWMCGNILFVALVSTTPPGIVHGLEPNSKQYYNDSSLMVAAEETGLNGTVNAAELTAIMYLRFPQRYRSIINRFGMPYSRDRYRDFYKIAGARNWVAIEYRGTTAVGYILISD